MYSRCLCDSPSMLCVWWRSWAGLVPSILKQRYSTSSACRVKMMSECRGNGGGGRGGTDNQLFTSEDFSVITKFHTSSCLIHHPSFTSLHVCSFSQSFSLSLSLSVSLSLSHSHTQTLKYKIQGTMIRVDHSYTANKVCHNEAKNNNNNNNNNNNKKKNNTNFHEKLQDWEASLCTFLSE